jgi:hypothetical protein
MIPRFWGGEKSLDKPALSAKNHRRLIMEQWQTRERHEVKPESGE